MESSCLYCGSISSNSVGCAHVLPDAVIANTATLPRGAICDSCNQYLGHELDAALAMHPAIAVAIQFAAAPGKRGRARQELGGIAISPRDDGKIDIRMQARYSEINDDDAGPSSATLDLALPSRRDLDRIRRAIHHIGLNAFAYAHGLEAALAPRFDPVRRYVRRPHPKQRWSFLERPVDQPHGAPFSVGVFEACGNAFVSIRLRFTEFVVGLIPNADFAAHNGSNAYEEVNASYTTLSRSTLTWISASDAKP